ncbi:MAG: choice-of-anchor D domain-containing protein [Gammaproteobacteria bacterium]|nr:choice-of-anchor D domain-containing protein [Gammaproteobacteria bacterium]
MISRAGSYAAESRSSPLRWTLALGLFFGAQLSPAWADRTGGTDTVVSGITHTAASFSASITTDANGTGEYTLNFFVREAGATSGFYTNNANPASVPIGGNTTRTFSGSTGSLACGKAYEVTGSYTTPEPRTIIVGSAFTRFSTLPCATLSPATQSVRSYLGDALGPSATLIAANFNGAPTFRIAPSLPSGLTLNAANGVISGRPVAALAPTNFTITATGATSGSASASVSLTVLAPLSDLDALRYIASHPDLIVTFGPNVSRGRQHYLDWGFSEGRRITFEPLRYIATHPDLIEAFGTDETRATRHFIEWGYREGRRTNWSDNDALRYIASHPDLMGALGADPLKGIRHYIEWGYREGRKTTISELDALRYVATHADLILALGADVGRALRHFIQNGHREGRAITFDPTAYLALHADIKAAFGNDLAAATAHYITFGFREGRAKSVDLLPPRFSASGSAIAFGNQIVGTSATRPVTISNPGQESLYFSSVAFNAGASSEYRLSSGCGSLLPPGASCTINILFVPANRGAETATLTIAHNAAGSSATFAVSATGIAPIIEASATSIDFGSLAVNASSDVRTITFRNTGDAALSFGGAFAENTDSVHFPLISPCIERTIQPGGSCDVEVRFRPTSAGAKTGRTSFRHNAAGNPTVLTFRGTASGPGITANPSSISFGSQPVDSTSDPRSIVITNPGDATLRITEIGFSGTDATQFSQTNDCTEVAVGARCTIRVTFKPAGTVGSRSARLTLRHNSPQDGSTSISLGGAASAAAPVIGLSPRALEFTSQPLNTSSTAKVLRLSNRGAVELKISSITLVADDPGDFVQTNNCGATVAAGAFCELSVVFRPTRTGSRTAQLSIAHDASGSPSLVPLSGVGGAVSANNLLCGPALSAFRVDTAAVEADLDVRDAANKAGFEVRIPGWREDDIRNGIIEISVVDEAAAIYTSPARCPIVRLIDTNALDGAPTPCDLNATRVLAGRASAKFNLRFVRVVSSAGSAPRTVVVHTQQVQLGKATLTPPLLTGDVTTGQVSLAWRAVEGASSYRVYRLSSTGVAEVVGDPITGLSATLSATNDTRGTYVVRAFNESHQSGLSNPVRLTPAASPSTTLGVSDLQVIQAIAPAADGSIPLIAQKPGIVRAFFTVSGNSDGRAGIVRLSRAGEAPLELRGPILNTPVGEHSSSSCVATFDLRDAAARWFGAGNVDLTVEVDHGDSISASSASRKQLTKRFSFETQKPIQLKLVPISTDFGLPSDAEMSNSKAEIGALLNAMFPNAALYVETGETPFNWGKPIAPFSGSDWSIALATLSSLRAAELNNKGCDRFFYGLFKNRSQDINLSSYGGIGGMAYLPAESSLTGCPPLSGIGILHNVIGFTSSETAVHEIGHNHGLRHIAATGETNDVCGQPDGPDAAFPNAKGRLGVDGYDATRHRMIDATLYHDFMSYCQRAWISDYHYKKTRRFQELLFDSQSIAASSREALASIGALGGVLVTGVADIARNHWQIATILRLDGDRGQAAVSDEFEAEITLGEGEVRKIPVVLHDLDHSDRKGFELWVRSDETPRRILIRRVGGAVVFDWNSGVSAAQQDTMQKSASALAVREIGPDRWELEAWALGPRFVIRVRADQRDFVGNDEGETPLVVNAVAGDVLEVFAIRSGIRTRIVLGGGDESPIDDGVINESAKSSTATVPPQSTVPKPAVASAATASAATAGKATAATATAATASASTGTPMASQTASRDVDHVGSAYRLLRREADGHQHWTLEYVARGDVRIATRELEPTVAVAWFGETVAQSVAEPSEAASSEAASSAAASSAAASSAAAKAARVEARSGILPATPLPSTGWVRACTDQVWSVRDGYSLAIDASDPALMPRFSAEHRVRIEGPEALLVTGASCAAGGSLRLTGLSFIVDEENPTLTAASMAARKFDLVVTRDGSVSMPASAPAAVSVLELCEGSPANELAAFCSAVKKAAGW